MSSIKTFDFISKLGDVYFVLYNTLSIMKRNEVKNHIVNTMTQGGAELLLKYIVNTDGTKVEDSFKSSEAFKLLQKSFIDNAAQKVENYEAIFINQNLVMQCTIMEIFFLHILETIFEECPETIIGLAQEKNITLQQVMKLKSYNAIIDEFKSKIYDCFSREGLEYEFEMYDKIGLDTNKIFDYSTYTDEAKRELEGYDFSKLDGIFDKRHNIVHKNELPIKSLEELTKIKNFFEKIIFNLSTIVMEKYGILLDIQENLVKSGYPRDKIPVKQRKHDEE